MVRDRKLFRRAVKLRKQQLSYRQISEKLGIPKSTVSTWFANKSWSQKITQQLLKRLKGINAERLILMNKARRVETINRHNSYRKEAQEEFRKLWRSQLFIAGLSIYWGEGEKANSGRVAVINSDPHLLKVVINFYRHSLDIPEDKIRIGLFIYRDHDVQKMVEFWSKELKVSRWQFIKTQVLPSGKSLTRKSVKYGVCSVYFSSTKMNVKIQEWIRLLGDELRV